MNTILRYLVSIVLGLLVTASIVLFFLYPTQIILGYIFIDLGSIPFWIVYGIKCTLDNKYCENWTPHNYEEDGGCSFSKTCAKCKHTYEYGSNSNLGGF